MAKLIRFAAEAVADLLPIGQAVKRDYMVQLIWNSIFAPKFADGYRPLSTLEVTRRKRHCESLLKRMIRNRTLIELPDGRIRRDLREEDAPKITFTFAGITHTVKVDDYETKLAELRSMSPEAKKNARLEALEQQIAELRKAG
jgi:hypothetical protein